MHRVSIGHLFSHVFSFLFSPSGRRIASTRKRDRSSLHGGQHHGGAEFSGVMGTVALGIVHALDIKFARAKLGIGNGNVGVLSGCDFDQVDSAVSRDVGDCFVSVLE